MAVDTDTNTLVLHGLRLKGFAEAPAVAEAVGVPEADAKAILDTLVSSGLALYRDGRMSGFTLTPDGRREHARLLSEELDQNGLRDAVDAAYRRFLQHNGDLLAVCTDWQLRPGDGEPEINDHSDPDYDRAVIERLAEINGNIEPVCVDLAGLLSRFGRYQPALANALERLQAGDLDWFTKPMIDSYHTIWFELHEDLLATLGIERGSEEAV